DEDYGYVTLEGFLARKPVVTTSDAGGPLEFVEDDVNGFIVEPDAEPIAAAIARLARDPARAKSLGEAGYDRARSITWDGAIDRLRADAGWVMAHRRWPLALRALPVRRQRRS